MGLISNGTSIFDAGAMAAGIGSSMSLIKKITASSSADISFVNGSSNVVLDTTYKEYMFYFHNIHPATDSAIFQVGFRDGGTDYDAEKVSTYFYASHKEDDTQTVFAYEASYDQLNSTSFHNFNNVGNGNSESISGYMHFFSPGSTAHVKHFITRFISEGTSEQMSDSFVSGFCNTTTAIDAVQFKMSSGNIDAGTISLYGIA